MPYCEKNGISFIPYFPLASGLLTGKFTKTQSLRTAERTGRRFREKLFTKIWSEWISFGPLRRKRGADSAYRTRVASVATGSGCDHSGAKRPDQLKHNLDALNVQLTEDEVQYISDIFK
ncbi:aldo/keto reductase [Bacillus velezensis]|nr:aldo/keto reductase [Bacillus velezensis]